MRAAASCDVGGRDLNDQRERLLCRELQRELPGEVQAENADGIWHAMQELRGAFRLLFAQQQPDQGQEVRTVRPRGPVRDQGFAVGGPVGADGLQLRDPERGVSVGGRELHQGVASNGVCLGASVLFVQVCEQPAARPGVWPDPRERFQVGERSAFLKQSGHHTEAEFGVFREQRGRLFGLAGVQQGRRDHEGIARGAGQREVLVSAQVAGRGQGVQRPRPSLAGIRSGLAVVQAAHERHGQGAVLCGQFSEQIQLPVDFMIRPAEVRYGFVQGAEGRALQFGGQRPCQQRQQGRAGRFDQGGQVVERKVGLLCVQAVTAVQCRLNGREGAALRDVISGGGRRDQFLEFFQHGGQFAEVRAVPVVLPVPVILVREVQQVERHPDSSGQVAGGARAVRLNLRGGRLGTGLGTRLGGGLGQEHAQQVRLA